MWNLTANILWCLYIEQLKLGGGRGELIQLKCGYVEISEEIIEILPAGNEKMFDSVEHWPG